MHVLPFELLILNALVYFNLFNFPNSLKELFCYQRLNIVMLSFGKGRKSTAACLLVPSILSGMFE